jgi:hypothetical protein
MAKKKTDSAKTDAGVAEVGASKPYVVLARN